MGKGKVSQLVNYPSDTNIEFQTGRISENENGSGQKYDFVQNVVCDNKTPIVDGDVYNYTLIDIPDDNGSLTGGKKVAVDLEP